MDQKAVIKNLLANKDNVEVKGVKVINAKVAKQDNYVRVSATLDKEVDGYLAQEDGTYTLGKTNVIFFSMFSVTAQLKQSEDTAFCADYLLEHPEALRVLMSYATITIIQEKVKSGTEYKNPFSEDAKSQTFDHDSIINHLCRVEFTERAMEKLDKISDKLLGL